MQKDLLYPEINTHSRILLGPGPSMVHPRVLRVMSTPLVGHLDPQFLELMDRTKELLQFVFETENNLTIPVSGTGSAAMEASIANIVEPGDKMLICVNGYFGQRLENMAKRYGAQVETIQRSWGEVFDPQEVEDKLKSFPAKVTAIVHAETSTGALQPLKEISEVVHQQDGLLIVDAVTSLGGLSVGVDRLGIDVCYSGTQKCLSAPPGLGPVTLSKTAVEVLKKRKTPVANWYLDMSMVQEYWGKERTYHHTAPITANFALYEALRIVHEEGLEARWQRHKDNAMQLWQALEEIGLACHVPLEHRLPSLTTVKVPEGVDEAAVRRQLLHEYNIEIAGGLGELKDRVWRIGLMGYSSRRENIALLVTAMKNLLDR